MMKIYEKITRKKGFLTGFCIKAIIVLILSFIGLYNIAGAQITLTATAGVPAGSYTTLKGAFDAINSGDHKGNIIINIASSTNEGTTPATLNSSDADPANYTSVLIQPVANNIIVSGNPAAGFGVIQLNGADNVTINGDNPISGGQARTLSVNNTALSASIGNSCIRICTSAAITDADNITIINCNLNGNVINGNVFSPGSSSLTSFGIYAGGNAGATITAAPTPITTAFEPAPSGTKISAFKVQNNAINQCGRAVVFNAAAASVSNNVTIIQNLIGTAGALGIYPYTTPATTVYCNAIWIAGTNGLTITNNIINNIISYVNSPIAAIELNANIIGVITISDNTITAVVSNSGNNLAAGISVNPISGVFSIAENIISIIENSSGSSTAPAGGIRINTNNGSGTISSNNITAVNNRNVNGGPAQGINLGTAPNGIVIKNNFISNIMNTGLTSFLNTANANGILINSGNNHKVYHNSINLYGNSTSSGDNSINCLAISSNTLTGIDIRNNAFSNTVTGGFATDVHTCIFLPFAVTPVMKLTLNNNAYYTGNSAGLHGIAFAGNTVYSVANLYNVGNFIPSLTTGLTNFRNFSSSLGDGSNDFASFGSIAAAPFTSVTDLHIPAATATALESGGTGVLVITDFDGNIRNVGFPDIGADEFAGTIVDNTPPLIEYSPLYYTCTLGDRSLVATITDPSGVPLSGIGLPVLYWSINAGAYVTAITTYLGSSQYQFDFGAGAILGDVIRYYIVAQDNNGNVIASLSVGATGYTAGPPAASTPPTAPDLFTIQPVLAAGTYNVGAGQTYTTITAAINDYNTSCLGGPIVFRLMDAAYSAGETFPIVIGNPEASAINTLTIQPNAAVAVTITGSNANSLFKFNGADYVKFDGLNAGFSSMTLTNSNPTGSIFWIASENSTNGATNDTIINCRMVGAAVNSAFAAVFSGSGTTIGNAAEAPNSNNRISNCTFKSFLHGVFISGYPATNDLNWNISNNIFGSSIAGEKLGNSGVSIQQVNNFIISGNTINGVIISSALPATGISVLGHSSNGIITSNKISDIYQSSALGGSYGINLSSIVHASNITVNNNFIWGVSANGSGIISNNGNGILISSGGGYSIFYNSVNMATNQIDLSSITSAIRIAEGVVLPNSLNILNNIFVNTTTVGTIYSIFNESAANIFADINYNDYFTGTSTDLGFLEGDRQSLSAWQLATGKDSKSVVIIPGFVSATDLHLQVASQLNALGSAIGSVTTDIDNTARVAPTDIGADEFDANNCSGSSFFIGAINTSVTTLCNSGPVYLTALIFAALDGLSYQWQSSTDGITYTDIPGQTVPTNAFGGIINVTTWFRLKATCSNGGGINFSAVKIVTVNSPVVSTNTPGTRCGIGTVNLAATTVTSGATLNWYSLPSGGTSLGTGNTFTTPVISATTNYYVAASLGSVTGSVGPTSPSAQGGDIGTQNVNWKVFFDVLQTGTLKSLDIFPKVAGLSSTLYVKNSSGVIIGTYPYTTAYSGGATSQTITMNLAIVPGTGYFLEGSGSVPNLYRNTSGAVYPYTSSVINITGNSFDNTYYMCYYNFQFSGTCVSPRTTVTATVTLPPAILPVATPAIICLGSTSTLSVTSVNGAYSYVWTPGSLPGASVIVTPATTTIYTVTANDGTCSTTGNLTVQVRPVPTAVTVTPATGTVCINGAATLLTASGGILSNVSAINENFNAATNSWIKINNGTGGTPANADWTLRPNGYNYTTPAVFVFNSNDASQFYLSNSESQGSGTVTNTILQSPAFSLSGFTTANLRFWHHFKYSGGESAIVEVSTDGSNWSPLAGGTFTTDQGTSNSFVNAVVNMDAYAGIPIIYIRFRYNNANYAFWWAIDNVNVTGSVDTDVTWTQAPVAPNSLFSDVSASIPYVLGTVTNTVYTQPGITTTYTATSSGPAPSNCKSTSTATITVTPAVSVTITASENPICPSTVSVVYTAVVINGGPSPNYQWQVNGANVGTNSPTYTNFSPSNGDLVTATVIGNGSCTFGNPATSNIITMVVAPPTGVGLSIVASPGNFICDGTAVTFTATATNGGPSPTYQWKLNGANVGPNSSVYVNSTLANGDQVICNIVSNSSCITGVNTAVSDQILMTVNGFGPTAVVIGIFGNTTTICEGTQVTVRATPTNPGLAPNYEFFKNLISVQSGPSNDYTFIPVNGDKIRVRITSNYTCLIGVPIKQSNTLTMTVLANAPASVLLSNTTTFCTGTPIIFTATPTNGGLAPTYDFLLNGLSVQNSASNTYTLVAPANGNTVSVIMTSSFACATGNPASSSVYTVALNASPTVTAATDCNNLLSGSGQQATLTATATAGSGSIISYQWVLNGVTNVGINSPTYTTSTAGTYTVVVTNSNGCATISAIPIVITNITSPLTAGTYIIPGTGCGGFDKISSAVNYINAYGIAAAGSIIFNITPGYLETAPAGGFAITATGTSVTNNIIFKRNGAGANPVITAGMQTAGTDNDGIFKIIGGDFITIQDLTLEENAGNAVTATGATNTMTEWGVALLYATPTNGPNNNTIQNNIISLDKAYPNSFGIYSNLRHNATATSTSADISNTTGGFNKIYSNAISNVNNPVFFLSAGAAMSPGNDIGGSSVVTANAITNWGTNSVNSGSGTFFGVMPDMNGIYAANQTSLNISSNNITSATGIDAGPAAFRGICTDFITTAPSGTFTNTITNNTITLNSDATTGTFQSISQLNTVSATAVPGFTLNINSNTIGSALTGTASGTTIVGISNAFPSGTLSISNNISKGNTSTATTAGFTGITNTAAVSTTININNNQFGDATTNAITFSAATNSLVQGISNTGAAAASILSVNGNSFTRFVHTATGTSDHTYISNTATLATQNINTNSFTNINTNSNGALTGISSTIIGTNKVISGNIFSSITGGSGSMTMITTSGGSTLCNVNNNNIGNNIAGSITGTGSLTGINLRASGIASVAINTVSGFSSTGTGASVVTGISTATPTATITSNIINTLNSSGNGSVLNGISIASGTSVNISLNTIHAISGTGTGSTVSNGVSIGSGTSVNVFKNKIYDLSQTASTGGVDALLNGILISGGTSVTVQNNFISDLKTPVANSLNAIRGISITSSVLNSNYNIYYNSIYLNASSTGTDLGTSGIFHTGSATATTAALNLRNNIIDNESIASGAGQTVAFRNAGVDLNNYATTSNNNSFFAGTPGINNLIYQDGTNSDQTLADYQARVIARDASSVSVSPNFINKTTTPYDLHLQAALSCSFDGQGNNAIILIADDIDADVRSVVPSFITDIGADEFNGTGAGIGTWNGVNTNWNDIQNWCDAIPTAGTNVTIPAGKSFYPVIITATPVAKNISIAAGGSVIITGTGKLGIYGSITNAGTFNVVDGTIEMLGTAAQIIPAAAFQNNDIKSLIISNVAASPGVTLGGALNLYGKLSFTGSNRTFTTAGFLTLRSTATGTASVADITNNSLNTGNNITGDVSVERFITDRRAWRLLSVPTQHNLQTIKEAWQENMPANSNTQTTPAGYGIHITKDSLNWLAYGFDLRTPPGPSMKTYQPVTNNWKGITSTVLVPGVSDGKFVTGIGYMTLIRGDRTVNTFPSVPTTTVLRDKGALVTGPFAAPVIGAGLFAAIGNPYASAVDFTKLTTTNLQDVYYLWDPGLGSLGGYVTFAGPTYNATSSVSYTSGNKFIESGQAFFVKSSGLPATLSFTEPSKVDGSYLVTRPAGTDKQLRTNLYLVTGGTPQLYDGVLCEFDNSYSNTLDGLDAKKLVNFGENLGIKVSDSILSVERRAELTVNDTIFYNLAQVRVQNYQFEFIAENIGQPGLTGFLEDKYLNTSSIINMNGITKVNFNVINDSGSYAKNRFRLVFKQLGPVPVTFTSIRANKQNRDVLVEWKVENELNIQHYEILRSANGRNFNKTGEQAARGNGSAGIQYNWLDTNPLEGDNFYRIKSIGINGEQKLSQIVKVNMGKLSSEITVFPNPIREDGILYVSLENKPAGLYLIKLISSEGKTLMMKTLNHAGGNSVQSLELDKFIAHGNYLVNITGEGKVQVTFKIVY